MVAEVRLFLTVLPLLLVDSLYNHFLSPLPYTFSQTFWWFVNISSAPLLFSTSSPPRSTLIALAALYATRFLLEALTSSHAHWLFAVSRSARAPSCVRAPSPDAPVGAPVLSGFDDEDHVAAAAHTHGHAPHAADPAAPAQPEHPLLRWVKSRAWPPRRRFFNAILARDAVGQDACH